MARAIENVSIASGDGSVEATVAAAITSPTVLSNISGMATQSYLIVADPNLTNAVPVLADNTGALAPGKMVYTYSRSGVTSTDANPVQSTALNAKGKDLYLEVAVTTTGTVNSMDFRVAIETRSSSGSSNWHQIARLKDLTTSGTRIVRIRANGGALVETALASSDLKNTANTSSATVEEGPYGEQIRVVTYLNTFSGVSSPALNCTVYIACS